MTDGVAFLKKAAELAHSLSPEAVDLMLDCARRGLTCQVTLNYKNGQVPSGDYRQHFDFDVQATAPASAPEPTGTNHLTRASSGT